MGRRVDPVTAAQAAAAGWRQVVAGQRRATPSHSDFYALAAEMVDTLHAFEALTCLLGEQVRTYGHGRAVYDDTHTVDPHRRLAEADGALAGLQAGLAAADRSANAFFSAIGHIGVDPDGPGEQR